MWLQKENGFTLLELLVTMMVTGIIISTAGTFFLMGQKANDQIESWAEIQASGRASMHFMIQEIRNSSRIIEITPHKLTVVNYAGNKIVYQVVDGILRRDFYQRPSSYAKSTSQPLTYHTTEISFEPCVFNGVKLSLKLMHEGRTYTLKTVVTLRSETY